MATAPALAEAGTTIPGEQLPTNDDGPVDFEAEARKMGWTPPEDFKGDPKHHLDAETFYNRAIEYMPIAKATIKKLSNRLDAAERTAKQAAEFFSKAEQRAYERALSDIRAEQEAAVESGDVEAHRKAAKKLDDLEKPSAAPSEEVSEEQRAEEFADWGKANKWYATNPVMQAYADSQASILARTKNGILDRADLDTVAEKVKARFSDEYPDDFAAVTPRPKRSSVEGGGQPAPRRGSKTYNDLPPEARAMCDKWVKNGTIKSRDDYVKSYQWDK